MPNSKQVLAQIEYVNYERKMEVQCEITCLEIKATTSESVKLLVFKFSKNEKGEKKKNDDMT